MKIGIVGSGGYLGASLTSYFNDEHDLIRIDRSKNYDVKIDLEHADSFDYNLLNDIEFIVYVAAVSSPDACATEFEKSWNVNVNGTCHFISEALKHGTRVIFFSSDAVYGPDFGEPFDEFSVTNPITPYGKMKKAVEDYFNGEDGIKSVRLSYVLSTADKFTSYCRNCLAHGETANVFHPFYRNVISLRSLEEIVEWLLMHWNDFSPQYLNAVGRELVSRVRIADEFNRMIGNKLRYIVCEPDSGFFKNRPAITQVHSRYLDSIIKVESFSEVFRSEMKGRF